MISGYGKRLRGDGVRAILARGASGAFAAKVIGTGVAFGVHVLMARLLGVDSYGIYIYIFTWMTLFALAGQFGMGQTAVRLIADYHANESWSLLRGFVRRSQQVVIASSLILSVCAIAGIWLTQESLGAEFSHAAWIAAILLPVYVLLTLRLAYLQAYKRVVLSIYPQEILRPALFGLTAFSLVFIYGIKVDAVLAMGAQLLAVTVALLLASFYLRNAFPVQSREAHPEYKDMEWGRIGLSLMLVSGYSFIFLKTDTIMVGLFLGTTQAGIYAVATKVSNLINFGYLSIGAIAAPMISQLYSQGKMDELQKMITFAAQGLAAFSLTLGLGVIFWGESILSLFGVAFTEGYSALVILSVGLIVIGFTGIGSVVMVMTGRQNEFSRMLGMVIAANFALDLLLIPEFGMMGAAIATTVTWVSLCLTVALYTYRHFRVNITIIPLKVEK